MQVKNGGGHGAKARRRLMGEMLREVPVIPSDLKSLAVLNEPLIAVWGVQGHTRPVLIWPSSARVLPVALSLSSVHTAHSSPCLLASITWSTRVCLLVLHV